MFNSKRSGIPVLGTATKSSIPVVKKTANKTNTTTSPRNTPGTTTPSIPNPAGRGSSSQGRSNGSTAQAIKPSNSDLPNDPKLLKAQILDLHKKLDNREETMNELNQKLTRKSEECGYLVDEMDTVRRRKSVDLQQVTKEYVELQDKLQGEQRKVSEIEKNHREENECLQLELDVLKGEHEMELSMLRKELIDVRNKSEQRGVPLDVERTRLVANYEKEIRVLKDQLQQQAQKVHEATEKLEQKEFELHEKVNEVKYQYDKKHGFIVAEHKVELENLEKRLHEDLKDGDEKRNALEIRKEHEVYVETMKEQFAVDLQQLRTELEEVNKKIIAKETEAADDLMTMRNEYETQLACLRTELKNKEEFREVAESSTDALVEQLKLEHSQGMKEIQELHRKELVRIQLEGQGGESGDDVDKGSLESELQQKRQLETYEHDIRNLRAELKKERLDFTEARELLEGNITDMEQEMKEREETIRRELNEQHQYEIEVLNDEHEKVLHEKQSTHKHKMVEVRNEHEELFAKVTENLKENQENKERNKAALEQHTHETEIEELKLKHELELENLQETLENLQMEHEELQTEYDLIVSDLASELETTKLKVKGDKRRNSGVLKEQIGKLKNHNEENVQHLTEELRESKRIISSLNEDIAMLTSQEQNSLRQMNKITELEELLHDMQSDKKELVTLQQELNDHKVLVEKLQVDVKDKEDEALEANKKAIELQQHADVIQKENEVLQTKLARLGQDKEAEASAAGKKVMELQKYADDIQNDNQKIRKKREEENQRFENEIDKLRNEMQQEVSLQKLNYEEMISKLKHSIEELETERQTMDEEQQRLRDDLQELQTVDKSEPHIIENESFSISSENIDMIGDGGLEDTDELKYDQTMKGMVEEFENKIKELHVKLTKVNQDLTAKNNRLQSVSAEMNVLRENLANERNMVQNLEDRCQKLIEKHDEEIKHLRLKHQNGTEDSRHEIAALEKQIKRENDALIESLREDKENELATNKGLTEEINRLTEQHENIKQQFIKQEAKHVAEEIRQNDEKSEMMKSLQDELIERKQEITSLASLLETERSEHARKVKDLEFLVEQLTSNENKVKDLVNEVQKQQKESGYLRNELAAERKRIEEKMAEFQRDERTKSAEIDSLASMIEAERRAHSQKIEQLKKEIKKKASEVNALSSMLEKEQTSHEKTINDTHKHFAKLEEVENKNDALEEEVEKLKSKMRKMKAELTRQEQENNELLQRSKQITMDELEEVQHLNRSLTEAELHKGKLLREVESSKEELHKTQDRYNKTRDKLKTVKQKWHKDHNKLEEILHSPRVDMGLQTSLIEPEDLEVTKTQLSDSMRANTRLVEELKGSKGNLDGFKNDMHALKRANNILIKQNQVLYLETEGYKKNVDTLTLKMDQLREVSIKLTTDSEKLELENKGLNEWLERTEVNLSKAEGEKSSIDALNESSQSELEGSKINCYKLEEENARLKNQNDFLLSQAKRLQERVDELENEIKQLKRDLLVKEVDIINKERLVSAMQSEKLDSMLLGSSVPGPLFEHESFNDNRTHRNHNGVQGKHNDISESRGEKTPSIDGLGSQKQDLVSHIQSLKDSVGNNADGDKGYVGIKSYQVIEWDTNKKSDESQSKDDLTSPEPLDGLQLAKIKQLEFDSSNYLGSAYWDTMNFLKTMKSSN